MNKEVQYQLIDLLELFIMRVLVDKGLAKEIEEELLETLQKIKNDYIY